MDSLDLHLAKRRTQGIRILILIIISTLLAILVEGSIISRVWIKPLPGHGGVLFYLTPVVTAFPLLLCLSLQLGVRKALRSGDLSPKMADAIGTFGGIMVLITYQAMEDLMRLIS